MSKEQNAPSHNQPLSFIEPFDVSRNDISPEELQAVRTKFETLFSDIQLGHIEGTAGTSFGTSTTLLKRPDDTDQSVEWLLLVHEVPAGKDIAEQYEADPETATLKHLSIGKKDGLSVDDIIGKPRETFIYTLGLDGIVRRKDRGDAAANREQREAGQEDEVITDQELQGLSGQNDQPVSLKEIEDLDEFVRQPGWQPPQMLVLGIKALSAYRNFH